MSQEKKHLQPDIDLDAQALLALSEARATPPGPERSAAMKRAGIGMLRTSMDWLFRSSDGPRRKGCRRNTDAGSHLGIVIKPSHRGETVMPTAEQCNAYAADYRLLVQQVDVSIRSAATLMAISQSWTILADQIEQQAYTPH